MSYFRTIAKIACPLTVIVAIIVAGGAAIYYFFGHTLTIVELKDLTPFLAVAVSILALTIGPFITGQVAHAQAVASMREKWIYAFRDTLVELVTEFDVQHEWGSVKGIAAGPEAELAVKKLRTLENRVRLMVHSEEPRNEALLKSIDEIISMLVHGIDGDYPKFHALNKSVKNDAEKVLRHAWKKIDP